MLGLGSGLGSGLGFLMVRVTELVGALEALDEDVGVELSVLEHRGAWLGLGLG